VQVQVEALEQELVLVQLVQVKVLVQVLG